MSQCKYIYLEIQKEVTDSNGIIEELDNLGEEGWKLVNSLPLTEKGTTTHIRFYFIQKTNRGIINHK